MILAKGIFFWGGVRASAGNSVQIEIALLHTYRLASWGAPQERTRAPWVGTMAHAHTYKIPRAHTHTQQGDSRGVAREIWGSSPTNQSGCGAAEQPPHRREPQRREILNPNKP